MRRDLRDKIETLSPERQEKIKARTEELMEDQAQGYISWETYRERVHQLEDKAYRYGLELADRRLEAADLATEKYRLEQEVEKLRAENDELRAQLTVAKYQGQDK